MKNLLQKIIELFRLYKWLLLPIIPAVLFGVLLVYLFLIPTPQQQPSQTTLSPSPSMPPDSEPQDEEFTGAEAEKPELLLPGFQKKEVRSDGTIVYTYSSINPNRPDMVITTAENETIFTRKLPSETYTPAKINVYKQAYGDPEKIVEGSKIYGSQASTYIYPSIGLAFIGNKQTGEVYEEHFFKQMSADAYMQRYGNQN